MAKSHIKLPVLRPKQIARFERRVKRGAANECWPWLGGKDDEGYGIVSLVINGKERHVRAHRIAYYLHNGKDPSDQIVCHSCDNPPCSNPAHLFTGTHGDNARDRTNKRRGSIGVNHYFHLRPDEVPKGEKHGMAKLTEADVLEIRRLADSHSHGELGKQYGVHRSLIRLIVLRKNWTHI